MFLIRKRVPHLHDKMVHSLVYRRLYPFARQSTPGLRFESLHIRRRLRQGITFVAETGFGKPVGFVHVQVRGTLLWIDLLAVDTNAEGQGLGSRLLSRADSYGIANSCREASLFVDRNNRQAQYFYQKRGFQPVSFEPKINCYMMSKPLNG